MSIKKAHIALVCAVPIEAAGIMRKLTGKDKSRDSMITGKLGNLKVALACSDPGIAAAASCATILMERFNPEIIINFGIAGAFHGSGLKPGDTVCATSETFAEFGADTKGGFLSAREIGLWSLKKNSKKYYQTYPLQARLIDLTHPYVTASGPSITVSTVTGKLARANNLKKRFKGVLCENMEGAAVAHVAARYGIPMIEIRGISNMVDNRNTDTWDVRSAVRVSQHSLMGLLSSDKFTELF